VAPEFSLRSLAASEILGKRIKKNCTMNAEQAIVSAAQKNPEATRESQE
jgi:hypothetical protein